MSVSGRSNGKTLEYQYKYFNSELKFVADTSLFIRTKFCDDLAEVRLDGFRHTLRIISGLNLTIQTESMSGFKVFSVDVEIQKNTDAYYAEFSGDFAWVVLHNDNKKGMLKVNWRTGDTEFFPIEIEGVKDKKIKIEKLDLTSTGEVLMFIEVNRSDWYYDLYVYKYDVNGNQEELFMKESTLFGYVELANLDSGGFLLAGTFNERELKQFGKEKGVFYFTFTNEGKLIKKEGIYFSEIPGYNEYSPKEYKKHFGGHRSVFTSEILKTSSGFIIYGESYYSDYNGDKWLGDFYTHGFVCVLDNSGNLKWSDTFGFSVDDRKGKLHFTISKKDDEIYLLMSGILTDKFEINLKSQEINSILDPEQALRETAVKLELEKYSNIYNWGQDYLMGTSFEYRKTQGKKTYYVKVTRIER